MVKTQLTIPQRYLGKLRNVESSEQSRHTERAAEDGRASEPNTAEVMRSVQVKTICNGGGCSDPVASELLKRDAGALLQ